MHTRKAHTQILAHSSANIRSGLGHHWAQPKYSHINSFSSSLCPTVFVIILQLKLCMLSPVWCASLPLLCSLPLRNCLSAALLLSGSLFFSLISTLLSSAWRIKGYISFIPVCVLLSLKMTLSRCSLSNRCPMEGDKGQLPCLAHFKWQLHAGPSEKCLQGRKPGSNALLKCVKRDAFMLLSNHKCILERIQCPI